MCKFPFQTWPKGSLNRYFAFSIGTGASFFPGQPQTISWTLLLSCTIHFFLYSMSQCKAQILLFFPQVPV